jgi:hypothetical protein
MSELVAYRGELTSPWGGVPVSFPWPGERSSGSRTVAARFRRALIAVDAATISLAVALSYMISGITAGSRIVGDIPFVSYEFVALAVLLGWLAALAAVDAHDPKVLGAGSVEYRRILAGTIHLFGAIAIASYLVKAELSRGLFVVLLPVGSCSSVLKGPVSSRDWRMAT